MMDWENFYAEGINRVERAERVEGESGGLTDWEILTQRRRDAECAKRFGCVEHVEHVEHVEGERGFLTQRRRDAGAQSAQRGWPCRTCRTCRGGSGRARPPLVLQKKKERCSRSPMIHKRAKLQLAEGGRRGVAREETSARRS